MSTAAANSGNASPARAGSATWSGDIRAAAGSCTDAADVADVADKRPVLVAYTIPGRDWISASADGIGGKPAPVIIEGG
ncbi:hypothetical protein ACWEF6_19660 [Amycolatopsis sp. NPDC004772]